MVETFITLGESTLSIPAGSADPTFTLAAGAPFNVPGQYRLRLDDSLQQPGGIATRLELCRATFNAGNVVNAFRTGADLEGSTAQAWPAGTAVRAIVTAAALANYVSPATLAALPRGTLPGGFVPGTAIIGSIGAGAVSVFPGTPVTIAAGRRIKITSFEPVLASTVDGDMFKLLIYDGATEIGCAYASSPLANIGSEVTAMAVVTPSAGSHSYGTTAIRVAGTGTGTLTRTATEPAFLLIEDIGV